MCQKEIGIGSIAFADVMDCFSERAYVWSIGVGVLNMVISICKFGIKMGQLRGRIPDSSLH
jgi:hypothetical protein